MNFWKKWYFLFRSCKIIDPQYTLFYLLRLTIKIHNMYMKRTFSSFSLKSYLNRELILTKIFIVKLWESEANFFFVNQILFLYCTIKLESFLTTVLLSYATKWISLTVKIRKRRKTKFCWIGSGSTIY